MKYIQTLIIILISISISYAQGSEKTKCTNCDYSYSYDYEFDFSKIDSTEYKNLKNNYINKIQNDSTRIILKDTLFTIKTEKGNRTFNIDHNGNSQKRGFSWTEYKGYVPDLKSYVLNGWSVSEFTFGESYIIDSVTNKEFRFQSLFDGPNEIPVISPKNSYLISFANSIYEPEGACRLSLIKISQVKNQLDFNGYIYFETNNWSIDEIVWINENSFALKVNSKKFNGANRKWVDNFDYLKTSF